MNKKIIALTLTASLLFACAACSSGGSETSATSANGILDNVVAIRIPDGSSAEDALRAIANDYASQTECRYETSNLTVVNSDTNASELGITDQATIIYSSVDASGNYDQRAFGEIDVFVVTDSSQIKTMQPGNMFVVHHYETEGASEYDDTFIVTAVHGNYVLYILENVRDKDTNSTAPFSISYNQTVYDRFVSAK